MVAMVSYALGGLNAGLRALRGPLYANSMFLIANSVVSGGLGFVFWALVARQYPPESVGLASAMVSAMSFLGMVSNLGLGYAIIRFLPNSQSPQTLINTCVTLQGIVGLVTCGVFLAGLHYWSPALMPFSDNPLFFVAFTAMTLLFVILHTLSYVFTAKRRSELALLMNAIYSVIKVVLPFLPLAALGAIGIFAAWSGAVVVAVLLGLLVFMPWVAPGYAPIPTIKDGTLRLVVPYSFGNYLALLFWAAPGMILPLIVLNLTDAQSNAYFFLALGMSSLLAAIPIATSTSLLVEGSHDEGSLLANAGRAFWLSCLLLLLAIGVMFLLGERLLYMLGESYSRQATAALWVLSLSAIPSTLNQVYLGVWRTRKQMVTLVGFCGLIAVSSICIGYLLIPGGGIVGASLGILFGQGIGALLLAFTWLRPVVSSVRQLTARWSRGFSG